MTTPAIIDGAVTALAREVEAENVPHLTTVVITDADSYRAAAEKLKDFAARRKYTIAKFADMKRDALNAHRGICALENELLAPIEAADRKQRQALIAYTAEEERKRRAEEQRLQEEARQAEQTRLLNEAALLETQGHQEIAEAIVEQAETLAAPVVTLPTERPKVAGVTTAEAWTWRSVNGDDARAVELLAKTGNHCFLTLDTRKLGQYARMHKGVARLPGLEFFDAGKVVVRS